MKTPDDVVHRASARLKDTWTTSVLAEVSDAHAPEPPAWPYSIPVGKKSSAEIVQNFGEHMRSVQAWRAWGAAQGVRVVEERRLVSGTEQLAVTHIVVPDIETAAVIAGGGWADGIELGRTRAAVLLQQFPDTTSPDARETHTVLRDAARLSELDFDILLSVAHWFRKTPEHDRTGLTPRQIPLEGVHAKWLNTHQPQVRTLAGLDDLKLALPHPARVHFTYLDPDHLDARGRRHDSYSVGDAVRLPYEPQVVLITENKDTAVGFPRVRGGIAVEGNGTGGGTIANTPWIRSAPLVVYWGDMDVDGLEILDEFRVSGVDAVSMLMDMETYAAYQRYGTKLDPKGKPVRSVPRRIISRLEDGEKELYTFLTSSEAPMPRVEQERIPLRVAHSFLNALVAQIPTPAEDLLRWGTRFDPRDGGCLRTSG